jgi:transposase
MASFADERVPPDHPIRLIKRVADESLEQLSPLFDRMYSPLGRPSIPPERVLKAILLIALYSIRGEEQLCERLGYDVLFRFFLDMASEERSFDPSVFTKNRQRFVDADVGRHFFEAVVRAADEAQLLSQEHFTVDGTHIEAWASMKSFRRRGEGAGEPSPSAGPKNPTVDFHGEKRTNKTHASTTDPEALLARKGRGKEAKLCFSMHALMENRHGICVDLRVAQADGVAEREQAVMMVARRRLRGLSVRSLGADKAYDTRAFVADLRDLGVTPHVAQNTSGRRSSIDRRTTSRPGYVLSQRKRKLVEEIFGWLKTVGGLRKTRFKGVARTSLYAYLAAATYNLVRLLRLLPAAAAAAACAA